MRTDRGFSLAELMVAMLVTLLVSGAIYGLMVGGGSAFTREPARSDRQQNIRVALDMITEDIMAGEYFFDALNGTGVAGIGQSGTSDPIPAKSDKLYLVTKSDDSCPDVDLNATSPILGNGNSVNLQTDGTKIPDCYPEPGLYMIFYPTGVKVAWAHNIHSQSVMVNFPNGQQPPGIVAEPLDCSDQPWGTDTGWSCPADQSGCDPSGGNYKGCPKKIGFGKFIKYEIAMGTDGVPSLWRADTSAISGTDYSSATGGYAVGGNPGDVGWSLIARGVEDMQIRYLTHANYVNGTAMDSQNWTYGPGSNNAFTTNVRAVEVTLTARVADANLSGAQWITVSSPHPKSSMRGQLKTIVAPRATLFSLSASPSPGWW